MVTSHAGMDHEDLILQLQMEAIDHEEAADEALAQGDEPGARKLHLMAFEFFMRAYSHATFEEPVERGRMWIDAIDCLIAADECHRAWTMIATAIRSGMFTLGIRQELKDIRRELPPMA